MHSIWKLTNNCREKQKIHIFYIICICIFYEEDYNRIENVHPVNHATVQYQLKNENRYNYFALSNKELFFVSKMRLGNGIVERLSTTTNEKLLWGRFDWIAAKDIYFLLLLCILEHWIFYLLRFLVFQLYCSSIKKN